MFGITSQEFPVIFPMIILIAEVRMKRHWIVHRQFKPYPDGRLRWDRAYQYLLQWARTTEPVTTPYPPPSSPSTQEADHATSNLCTGVNPTPDREPND
jgi:hypothetical protein